MISSKAFLKVLVVSFGLMLFSAPPAHSSEVHVSNIRISSTGSLAWAYDPWLSIATAGVFDDPNGWTQAYDDDPGATGQAFASVSTLYASAQGYASSNLGKIDLSADLNGGGQYAYASGELYNLFQVDGPDPVNATFSLDWNAKINGGLQYPDARERRYQ